MTLKSDGRESGETEHHSAATTAEAFDPNLLDQDNPKVRQLLEAAGRLFMQLPYDAVSTDAIAKEAKVSKATLYVHFSSKENLFATLIGSRCHRIAGHAWSARSVISDVEQDLRAFAESFIDMLQSPDTLPLYRSIVSQTTRFPELGRLFYEMGPKRFEARLADFLTEATRRGLLRVPDPSLGALQFIQLMAGDVPTRGLLGLDLHSRGASEARIDSGIALFLAGYGPNAAANV
ncbi:TetR/AcrR family transcriptional regulator [bacterium]|nr:MAG: TetR/AcrR family transcriptional regulator [bacterium]